MLNGSTCSALFSATFGTPGSPRTRHQSHSRKTRPELLLQPFQGTAPPPAPVTTPSSMSSAAESATAWPSAHVLQGPAAARGEVHTAV